MGRGLRPDGGQVMGRIEGGPAIDDFEDTTARRDLMDVIDDDTEVVRMPEPEPDGGDWEYEVPLCDPGTETAWRRTVEADSPEEAAAKAVDQYDEQHGFRPEVRWSAWHAEAPDGE